MDDVAIKADFKESGYTAPTDTQRLLAKRINELSLKIAGTQLETLVNRLYHELEAKGITFKPKCYLTDEWGCPHGIPVIGIPFYLADPKLSRLEGELTGIEAENEDEIMMYLRHETGHAFNYAYRLYLQSEWRRAFGLFSTPYKEDYKSKPFDPSFVRHIPGWYAQKHPDEDFAETFAVWLTPHSNWTTKYNDTPALTKLLYVDRIAKKYGNVTPLVTEETFDTPIEELTDTLKEWYETSSTLSRSTINLPSIINEDLLALFLVSGHGPTGSNISAAVFIRTYQRTISQTVNHWTGIDHERIDLLIEALIKRITMLNLQMTDEKKETTLVALTAFITTLVMNYLYMRIM